MIGLSLNDSTRAAALDGALAMSVLLHNQRELTLGSARSGVTGLIEAIRSAPQNYAQLLDASAAMVAAFETSAEHLTSPAWKAADTDTLEAIHATIQGQLPEDEEDLNAHPLRALAGTTPTTYELPRDGGPSVFISTWGESGAISLTNANGQGIVIHHDGRVDTVPVSGHGWKFGSDGTFLLPDNTKVSVTPGSPASILITRGEQKLLIDGLQPGEAPEVELADNGGLSADASRNDGHIFVMGATPKAWELAGASLGQLEDERETVASSPVENELPADVTKGSLPSELVEQLTALGLDPASFDVDEDGLYSHKELLSIVEAIDAAIGGAQSNFDAAVSRIGEALTPLMRLTRFIEKALSEVDRKRTEREKESAEAREELRLIQRDLDAAKNALRVEAQASAPAPSTPPVEPVPVVLNRPVDSAPADPTSPANPGAPGAGPPGTSGTVGSGERPLPTNVPPEQRSGTVIAATPATQPPLPLPPVSSPEVSGMRRAKHVLAGVVSPRRESVPSSEPSPTGGVLPASEPTPPAQPATPADRSPTDASPQQGAPAREGSQNVTNAPIRESGGAASPLVLPPYAASDPQDPSGTAPSNSHTTAAPIPSAPPRPSSESGAPTPREFRRRLDSHLALHREHVSRMRQLQDELRQVVTQLVNLVARDDQLRAVFRADDLTDDQRSAFKSQVVELERELGIDWGGAMERTPQGEARLQARVLASGMMI